MNVFFAMLRVSLKSCLEEECAFDHWPLVIHVMLRSWEEGESGLTMGVWIDTAITYEANRTK